MATENKTPREQAIELVRGLENAYGGDKNRIQADLGKKYEKSEAQTPRNRVQEQHVIEIARAYVHVSDGNGGVIPKDQRTSTRNDAANDRYKFAQAGFMGDGRSPLTSQIEAIKHGLHDLLTPEMQQRYKHVKMPTVDSPIANHGNEGARPVKHAAPAKPAVERVSVSMGSSRPTRGFATVAMMATTAALTAIAIPALRHLGVDMKADEPAIRMTSLSQAASGLDANEPARAAATIDAGMSVNIGQAAALRSKPPTSSGPN